MTPKTTQTEEHSSQIAATKTPRVMALEKTTTSMLINMALTKLMMLSSTKLACTHRDDSVRPATPYQQNNRVSVVSRLQSTVNILLCFHVLQCHLTQVEILVQGLLKWCKWTSKIALLCVLLEAVENFLHTKLLSREHWVSNVWNWMLKRWCERMQMQVIPYTAIVWSLCISVVNTKKEILLG